MPQSGWPSRTSGYSKHMPKGPRTWWSHITAVVALGVIGYSSHSVAGGETGGVTSQAPQIETGSTLGRAQPTPNLVEQNSAISPHAETSQRLTPLVRHFLSGPEKTALAADVGELLRQGDITGAQQMLSAAVDMGSFAILISDGIQDPELQETLRAIASERQDKRFAHGYPAGDVAANGGRAEEQCNAAERERVRADSALHELDAMQGRLAASREKETRIGELEHALEQEKGRTALTIQDLNLVQEQLAAMTRNAIGAADARDEHAREVRQAKAALSELNVKLTEAHEQLALLKRSAAESAEMRADLERERDAARFAAGEIGSLKREIFTLQTTGVSPNGAVSSAAQEKERADAASQQLGAVREQLSALRESEAKMRGELKQEKELSASITRQLVASQREISLLKAQAADAASMHEALRQGKEATAAALHDVHALNRKMADLEARAAFVPAALLFQATPVLLKTFRTFEDGAKPSRGSGTEGEVSQRKARQTSLPPQVETEHKPVNEAAPQIRRHNLPQKAAEEKSVRSPSGSLKPTEVANTNTVVKLKRSPRLPAREAFVPEAPAPRLPATLLPVDGLWAFY